MTPSDLLLALGMFVSGTVNTINAKWAQRTVSPGREGPTTIWGDLAGDKGQGKDHEFDHPFFQVRGGEGRGMKGGMR